MKKKAIERVQYIPAVRANKSYAYTAYIQTPRRGENAQRYALLIQGPTGAYTARSQASGVRDLAIVPTTAMRYGMGMMTIDR